MYLRREINDIVIGVPVNSITTSVEGTKKGMFFLFLFFLKRRK